MKNINPSFEIIANRINPDSTGSPLISLGGFFMKEIWKDVVNYEGHYQVSNLGNVKSLKYGQNIIMKPIPANCYLRVSLYKDLTKKTRTVHQLVAESFLNHKPNAHKKVINHKNFIKTDNRVENLEIITSRENTNKKHLKSSSKYVGVCWHKPSKKWHASISIKGKIKYIGLFTSALEAHKAYKSKLDEHV